MAKRLSAEQKARAEICYECGCVPDRERLARMLTDPEELETLQYWADQCGIAVTEIVTLADLPSAEELHYTAAHYNWDDQDMAVLYGFINHPLCDGGTAALLFWKGAGYAALAKESSMAPKLQQFFQTLLDRFLQRKFTRYRIAFDPFHEQYVPSLSEVLEQGYRIPGELFCSWSRMEVDLE